MIAAAKRVGALRWFVALLAVATLPAAAVSDLQTPPWSILAGAVAPGIAFFLLWAIPFDMLMARVFLAGGGPDRGRADYRAVLVFDALLWLLLLVVWARFFWRLLNVG